MPLTDILTASELASASLIKIDIEGAEIPVVRHFLDHLDQFGRIQTIAVEASIAENPEWRELFDRFIAAGFNAYDIHNEYDWLALLDDRDQPPTTLAVVPDHQTDILFTRQQI